jgi:hypothetical protein
LIAQDRRRIEVFARSSGTWVHRVYGAGDRVELASIGASIEVDALYADAGVTAP